MSTNDRRRLIASLLIVTAAGLIFFWTAIFAAGLGLDRPPACYSAYARAFPVADGLLAVLMLIAGIMMMKNHPLAHYLALTAAGVLTFHGLVDISFNLQNGVYASSALDLVLSALLNIWCVGFGVFAAVLIIRGKGN